MTTIAEDDDTEDAASEETEAILPWSVHAGSWRQKKIVSFRLFFSFFSSSRSATPCVLAILLFLKVNPIFQTQDHRRSQSWVPEKRRPLVKSGRERPAMAWAMSEPKVKTSIGTSTMQTLSHFGESQY
jgi:hypothetical protein